MERLAAAYEERRLLVQELPRLHGAWALANGATLPEVAEFNYPEWFDLFPNRRSLPRSRLVDESEDRVFAFIRLR